MSRTKTKIVLEVPPGTPLTKGLIGLTLIKTLSDSKLYGTLSKISNILGQENCVGVSRWIRGKSVASRSNLLRMGLLLGVKDLIYTSITRVEDIQSNGTLSADYAISYAEWREEFDKQLESPQASELRNVLRKAIGQIDSSKWLTLAPLMLDMLLLPPTELLEINSVIYPYLEATERRQAPVSRLLRVS